MTRVVFSTMKEVKRLEFSYCHCEERAERGTRQSIVSRGMRTGLSLRLLTHSGSPRAFSPRDDKMVSKGTVSAYVSLFTLHPSIFTLPSLAFLETYTEAYAVEAVTGGVGVALS